MADLPENPTQKITLLKPIKHKPLSIGAIPTSYLVALSYEEQLLWLCHYLEHTVIPAFNSNQEAISELQELFIELKNYVDNYFNNLDISDELNTILLNLVNEDRLSLQLGFTYDKPNKHLIISGIGTINPPTPSNPRFNTFYDDTTETLDILYETATDVSQNTDYNSNTQTLSIYYQDLTVNDVTFYNGSNQVLTIQ